MAERGKVSRTIEDLREFKDKFKLSGEIERDLKKFHQNFNLQTTAKNGEIPGQETKEGDCIHSDPYHVVHGMSTYMIG
jgi:hypothetical protein